MRIGSMDRVPREKKKFSIIELSAIAILFAALCFVFINVIIYVGKWIIPIIAENYIAIIAVIVGIFILIKFLKGRRKKIRRKNNV